VLNYGGERVGGGWGGFLEVGTVERCLSGGSRGVVVMLDFFQLL